MVGSTLPRPFQVASSCRIKKMEKQKLEGRPDPPANGRRGSIGGSQRDGSTGGNQSHRRDRLSAIFKEFDLNSNGTVEVEELMKLGQVRTLRDTRERVSGRLNM